MKKSFSIIALAAILFASCQKNSEVKPTTAADFTTNNASLKSSAGADDNQPKHSGNDNGGTDDNLPKHSGKDDKDIIVPAKVLASFNKYFPGATVTEWKLTSDGYYKAHFTKGGLAYEATFKADGTLVKAEKAS